MSDRVKVRQSDQGIVLEQIIDGHVRLRGCVWRELRDDIPFWHGFRGIFAREPVLDAKGQLRPMALPDMERLEDFQEFTGSTLGKFLVWAVPE